MKKLQSLGKRLSKDEQKNIMGGADFIDPGGNCTSTCWIDVTTELGSVSVGDCTTTNASKCKDSYPSATKTTCSCD